MTEPQQAAQNHDDHEPNYLSHRQIMQVLAGLMMGMFLSALDQTIVATAIRTIGDDLNGLSLQAWVTTAYLITATITTPLYGKLGDIYGRKRLFLWSIGIFVVGSVLCTFADTMYQLAGFRAVQGSAPAACSRWPLPSSATSCRRVSARSTRARSSRCSAPRACSGRWSAGSSQGPTASSASRAGAGSSW